jgi:hypothetical protein
MGRGMARVNLAQLVRQRIPDRKGNSLPVDVSSVTYDLRDLTPAGHGLTTSELSVDSTWGVRAVQPPCPECCGVRVDGFVPDPIDLTSGNTDTVAIDGVNACNGYLTVLTGDFSFWSTNNASIATATSAHFHGVAAGETTGYANGLINIGGACACNFVPAQTYVPIYVGPYRVEPISTDSQGPAACTTKGQAGWVRNVTNQVQFATGAPYAVSGLSMADNISVGTPNSLGISGKTRGTEANHWRRELSRYVLCLFLRVSGQRAK